ncbi:hypothetical protein ACKLNO_00310 [Neisseriaceae bacterium B1]
MFILNLFNQAIQHHADIQHQLQGYNGIVIALHTPQWQQTARINHRGQLIASDRVADVCFHIPQDWLHALRQGKFPAWQNARIEGDEAIGAALIYLFAQLAQNIQATWQNKAEQLAHTLTFWGKALQFQATQLNTLPQPENDPSETIAALQQELQQTQQTLIALQTELRHLNRRLNYLEQQHNPA